MSPVSGVFKDPPRKQAEGIISSIPWTRRPWSISSYTSCTISPKVSSVVILLTHNRQKVSLV